MPEAERAFSFVRRQDVALRVAVDGNGPPLVVLPSFGRDGLEDFDAFTQDVVKHGWSVIRPQPRGIAGSSGPLQNIDLLALAADVAAVIEECAHGSAVVLGHAFGNFVARVLSVEHPQHVRGVVLAAASATKVPPEINATPFIAGDPERPAEERLEALKKAFFAPGHDPTPWLKGWYPAALAAQRDAVGRTHLARYWFGGEAPLLEIIPRHDPFKPEELWNELRERAGPRVTTVVIEDASHALFPEQSERVAEEVLRWLSRL